MPLQCGLEYFYENYVALNVGKIIYEHSLKYLRANPGPILELVFEIGVTFFDTVYEIKSDIGDIYIDKLYHEVLTQQEIETIVETINTALLVNIEEALKA